MFSSCGLVFHLINLCIISVAISCIHCR